MFFACAQLASLNSSTFTILCCCDDAGEVLCSFVCLPYVVYRSCQLVLCASLFLLQLSHMQVPPQNKLFNKHPSDTMAFCSLLLIIMYGSGFIDKAGRNKCGAEAEVGFFNGQGSPESSLVAVTLHCVVTRDRG